MEIIAELEEHTLVVTATYQMQQRIVAALATRNMERPIVANVISLHSWMQRLLECAEVVGVRLGMPHGRQMLDERYCEIALLSMSHLSPQMSGLLAPRFIPRVMEYLKRTSAEHGEIKPLDASDALIMNLAQNDEGRERLAASIGHLAEEFDRRVQQMGGIYVPLLYRLFRTLSGRSDAEIARAWRAAGFPPAVRFLQVERYPSPMLDAIYRVVAAGAKQMRFEYDPSGTALGYLTLAEDRQAVLDRIRSVLPADSTQARQVVVSASVARALNEFADALGVEAPAFTAADAKGGKMVYIQHIDYLSALKSGGALVMRARQNKRQTAVVMPYHHAVAQSVLDKVIGKDAMSYALAPHRSLWSTPAIRTLYTLANPSPLTFSSEARLSQARAEWENIYALALYWADPPGVRKSDLAAVVRALMRMSNQDVPSDPKAQELLRRLSAFAAGEYETLSARLIAFMRNVAEPLGLRMARDEAGRALCYTFASLAQEAQALMDALLGSGDQTGVDKQAGRRALERAFLDMLVEERLSRQMIGGEFQPAFDSNPLVIHSAHSLLSGESTYDELVIVAPDHEAWLRGPRGEVLDATTYLQMLAALGGRCETMWLLGCDYDLRGVKAYNFALRQAFLSASAVVKQRPPELPQAEYAYSL